MNASTLAGSAPPTLRIRGTAYPILLPKVRDPRLHLAFVIISLQVLGQTAFGFQLSIAQILVSLLTCAVIEFVITFHRQHVIMWPASALLTGNGVAFILRVPGTPHGDWWSLKGWWIFAGTAAVSILSKHVIRIRGHHIFNPSNFGLVLCFVLLGSTRADPLAFWWGPMSPWMVLALAIILVGAFAILRRLHLLVIAVTFWVTFAVGIAVIAASGHQMTARWHLGPITGFDFWRVVVLSPEVMIFLFFMITDPKTTPLGRLGRRVYAVSVALLAVLLIAPQTTEFWSKVALLGSLWIVCAARPIVEAVASRRRLALPGTRGVALGGAVLGAAAFAGVLVLAGIPARPDAAVASAAPVSVGALPQVTVLPSKGVETQIDEKLSRQIAADLVSDLRIESNALRKRDKVRAGQVAGGTRLQGLWKQIDDARGQAIVVPERHVDRLELELHAAVRQDPPIVVATLTGTERLETVSGSPPSVSFRGNVTPFARTLELQKDGNRYLIVGSLGGTPEAVAPATSVQLVSSGVGGAKLENVAASAGIDFQQSAIHSPTLDPSTMMGGGVCWLDMDNDGKLDLFAVNSFEDGDLPYWQSHGGTPRSGLFHNVGSGRFEDVSRSSGAGVQIRGNGCVAGDLNGDGFTDLYVTAAGYDALLWNDGSGHFSEGARAAGITLWGWHSGATIGDVNGDGRPDIFVSGYANTNAPVTTSTGFPNNYAGVRDMLYLNDGNDARGHARFREVGEKLHIDAGAPEHALGAVFSDFNGDGRLDLYVANDANPNRLYLNVPYPRGAARDPLGLGFRLEERAAKVGLDDPSAGMGIAAGDYSGDGRADLLVTNSHRQLHAVFRSAPPRGGLPVFEDARSSIASAFDTSLAGWGASWVDLDNDTNLDLVLANGAIPATLTKRSTEPLQAFENLTGHGHPDQFVSATAAVGLDGIAEMNGRGLAAGDYDNDGRVDLAVNTVGGKLVLLHNTGAKGHWLEVKLPVFAPGAVVTVVLPDGRRLAQEIHAGSSYLSSEDPRAHFGLGKATRVDELTVRYPGGRETRLSGIAVDQVVTLG